MDRDAMKKRMHERREALKEHGLIPQLVISVLGALLTLAGLAMLVLPGPAFVVLPLGLALLSVRFAWAARLLDYSIDRTAAVSEMSKRRKIIAIVLAVVAAAAAIVAYLLLA